MPLEMNRKSEISSVNLIDMFRGSLRFGQRFTFSSCGKSKFLLLNGLFVCRRRVGFAYFYFQSMNQPVDRTHLSTSVTDRKVDIEIEREEDRQTNIS